MPPLDECLLVKVVFKHVAFVESFLIVGGIIVNHGCDPVNHSDVLVVHLAHEGFKVGEFLSVNIEIVEASAPPRINVDCTYSNVSVLVSFDHVSHVLLVLIPSVQPDPVIVRPFRVGGTI